MSVDWAAIGVVSTVLIGGGGLAWKVLSDRRAEERERRAKTPDVKVVIEPTVKWWTTEDRAVRVRVSNHGDIPVRVVKISFKEGWPWERRVAPWVIADPTVWDIEEGEAELPKEIPPRDGHPFTLPLPVKQRVRVRPRSNRPRAVRVSPLRRKPVRGSSSRRKPARSSEKRIQAVATISTGEAFESPVYSSTQIPPSLEVVWDPSEGKGR
jgi:hypothetical protein